MGLDVRLVGEKPNSFAIRPTRCLGVDRIDCDRWLAADRISTLDTKQNHGRKAGLDKSGQFKQMFGPAGGDRIGKERHPVFGQRAMLDFKVDVPSFCFKEEVDLAPGRNNNLLLYGPDGSEIIYQPCFQGFPDQSVCSGRVDANPTTFMADHLQGPGMFTPWVVGQADNHGASGLAATTHGAGVRTVHRELLTVCQKDIRQEPFVSLHEGAAQSGCW